MKIAVSIGHTLSGIDSGAVGILNESKCTREIGALVKTYLEQQGHEVVFCRIDTASTLNESLAYRVNKANNAEVDLFLEIHLNAGGGKGVETYALAAGGQGEALAKNIQAALVELGYYNRGVKFANFYVLRNTNMPAVLVECGFVDSQEDCNRYNPDALAKKIVKGLVGVEPAAVAQTVQASAPTKPQKIIVCYANPVDKRAAEYIRDFYDCEIQDANVGFDYSSYTKVIAVGGRPTAFNGQWSGYTTDYVQGADRYKTMIAALKFIGQL